MQFLVDLGTFADSVALPHFDKQRLLVSDTHFSKWLLNSNKNQAKSYQKNLSAAHRAHLHWLRMDKIQLLN